MEESVLRLVEGYGVQEQFLYSSFNHVSMTKVKALSPSAKTAFLVSAVRIAGWEEYLRQHHMEAYHPAEYLIQNETEIKSLQQAGMQVNVWTVNMGSHIRKLCDWGIDGIITNRVELGCEIRDDRLINRLHYKSGNWEQKRLRSSHFLPSSGKYLSG